jgi:hypothetical protein
MVMEGHVGDRVVVRGRRVGQSGAEGEIVEVIGSEGGRRFRVRWSDDHESIMFPGADTVVEPADDHRALTLTCRVDVRLEEEDGVCEATATMMTERGVFRGAGTARRRPGDPDVPVIGEELATGRALRQLADRLEQAATATMPAAADDPSHLVR